MKNITEHLSYAEVVHTSVAKDNTPTDEQLANIIALAMNVFEPIRDHRGGPIKVNSVFRSAAVNTAIGGVSTSQHCANNNGAAIDLDLTYDEFKWVALNLEFDQLIYEFGTSTHPDWVHISFKSQNNRNMILKSTKLNGKTAYLPFAPTH